MSTLKTKEKNRLYIASDATPPWRGGLIVSRRRRDGDPKERRNCERKDAMGVSPWSFTFLITLGAGLVLFLGQVGYASALAPQFNLALDKS